MADPISSTRGKSRPVIVLTLVALLIAATVAVVIKKQDAGTEGTYPHGDLAAARSTKPGLRVLFVGNSFTNAYNLPKLVSEFAKADKGELPIFAVGYGPNGQTLEGHAQDPALETLINSANWDNIVLQEQRQRMGFPSYQRRTQVDPHVSALNWKAQAINSKVLLFMTWGTRDGDDSNYPGDTFESMTARVRDSYVEVGKALHIPVAPVGIAWQEAIKQYSSLDLWAQDGMHPSKAGSYLSAAVLYGTLTHRDVSTNSFTADLPTTEATNLKSIAAKTAWQ